MVSLTFYYFFFKQFLCSVPSLLVYPCVNVTGSMDSIAVSFIRSPNVAVVELIVTDQIIYDMGLTGLLDRDCFVNNAIFFHFTLLGTPCNFAFILFQCRFHFLLSEISIIIRRPTLFTFFLSAFFMPTQFFLIICYLLYSL